MATGDRKDPLLGFNFGVEVDGMLVAGFSEVSGLQSEAEIEEYREGGVNEYMHKRAGPIKYSANLVLKRGISDAAGLWSWYADVAQGKIQRKTVSIVLMDSACEERQRWNFRRAYPVRWVGPGLRAAAAEVAVETVELVHEGLVMKSSPPPPAPPSELFSLQLNVTIDGSF
jgi:phage tail-like protein